MADYIVKDTELTGVANSIRTAGSTSSLLTFPNGFISAINNISGGGGGGGSSIVNPINVTIVNNTGNTPSFIALASDSNMSETYQGGFYIDANGIAIINTSSNWMPTLSSGTNTLPTAYCLDNCMICIVDFLGEGYTYTLNGDATKTEVMGMDTIVITGDCTITIS